MIPKSHQTQVTKIYLTFALSDFVKFDIGNLTKAICTYKRKQVHQNRLYMITQHSIQWNAHSVVEGLSDTEVLFLRIKRGVQ